MTTMFPVWGPEFEIRFDVKYNSLSGKIWGTTINFGNRMPAIFTTPTHGGVTTHTLRLEYGKLDESGGIAYFYSELGKFEVHKWYSFVISQRKDDKVREAFKVILMVSYKQMSLFIMIEVFPSHISR